MNEKIKNAFFEIHAEETLKAKTFQTLTAKKSKKSISIAYKLAPIVAIFILFIFGNMYFTPVSYISIDINPSIELSINIFNRVIAVSANNADGEEIINSINLNNQNYIEALEMLADTESFSNFTDSYTGITIISDDSDEIISYIENCSFYNQNMSFYSANLELKEQALENDISFGKYRAYLELLEVNPTAQVDDIANLPMKVIRDMIENDGVLDEDIFSQGNVSGNEQNQNKGNENQNSNGKENRNGKKE